MKLRHSGLFSFIVLLAAGMIAFAAIGVSGSAQSPIHFPWHAYSRTIPATDAAGHPISPLAAAGNSALSTFPYIVTSSRDGNIYSGEMVGQNPFGPAAGLTTTTVNAPVVPVILTTDMIITRVEHGTVLATKPGTTVFDPTATDNSCLSSPNNVPLAVLDQSPIFQPADFNFGGTDVGATQYLDAFQRANFWSSVAGTSYHTLVSPQLLPPVSINVPGDQGLSIPAAALGACGPLAVVSYHYLAENVFPALLRAGGFNSSEFPIFVFYNTVLSTYSPTNLKGCCILGFHAATSPAPGAPIQTWSFVDFETDGAFGPGVNNTDVASHEIGEWMDDPFGNNPTPAWGHSGQVGGCQGNLEVGDPLTGTNIPQVTGTNGYAYNLQELAFFSWFYGAPSIAANGWFSDNDTFTTDAGPVCASH
jgi:hypothetical protein